MEFVNRNFDLLGSPFGDDAYVADYIQRKVLSKALLIASKLKLINHKQVRYTLLRQCLAFGPLVHIMRSVPPSQYRDKAAQFDAIIRSSLASLLGLPDVPERAWLQATLGVKLGGLGLRPTLRHLEAAFLGGCHQCASHDLWPLGHDTAYCDARATFGQEYPDYEMLEGDTQKTLSTTVEWATLGHLIDSSNLLDRARIISTAKPDAGHFWNVIPSKVYNLDIPPAYFVVITLWWLGIPLFPAEIPCPRGSRDCNNMSDVYGLHALLCRYDGRHGARHYALRNVIFHAARMAGLRCDTDQIIGKGGSRAADVLIWYLGKTLAIDVATTHPLQKIYLDGTAAGTTAELFALHSAHSSLFESYPTVGESAVDKYSKRKDEKYLES